MLQRYLNVAVLLAVAAAGVSAQMVRFKTNLGDIDVQLTPERAPATVANFLNYVNRGSYNNSIFHRSVAGFVIQAGGFQLLNNNISVTGQLAPVRNEFNVTNSRGTIAMAKLGNDPNSATNQWFFNLANNGANLDRQNGGFTVFGNVANSASLAVMDRIAGVRVFNGSNLNPAFDSLPLQNFTSGNPTAANYILVNSIQILPTVTAGGLRNAASFILTNTAGIAPGEILTIFGTAIGPAALATLVIDPAGVVTTSLAGTRVLFDGTPAPMIYSSAGQLSVVAPYNLAGKEFVNVTVEYQGIQTTALRYSVVPANPGLFTLSATGSGDAAIVRPDGTVINLDNPGAPGEVLVLYGQGYGMATPAVPDGTIIGTTLPVPNEAIKLLIDDQPVETLYAGGAPSLINGVLQINFRVPNLAPGTHQIQIQSGDRKSPPGVTLQTK